MDELSLHILDIAQNSIRANATQICITIDENEIDNQYVLTIEDDGIGMSPDFLASVVGALRATPHVEARYATPLQQIEKKCGGQGLPWLKHIAERANGNLEIFSEKNVGTKVVATFEFDHVNRLPLGDIAGVLNILQRMNPNLEFVYKHIRPKDE